MRTKVKEVIQEGTWNSNQGDLMYKHTYTFEDGVIMQASHKSVTPFPVGSEVDYEVKKNDPTYGKSGSVKKPQEGNFNSNNGGSKQSSTASFALSYAKDLAVSHIEKGNEFKTDHILQVASAFNEWLKNNA